MQSQHNPVLIFAQSGRFLAQSATEAGYSVWVADCFGDQDTLSLADRWLKIPSLVNSNIPTLLQILSELSQGENCTLICGSGIESCYNLLDELPKNIQLLGNSAQTIHSIKTPSLFFQLLDKLELPYPSTQFEPAENRENWLAKSASGLGGEHIKKLASSPLITDHYFQQQILGIAGSALFLANGKNIELISINEQLIDQNEETPFRLVGIDTPLNIENTHRQQVQQAITDISLATGLVGLNSLDFIISNQNRLFILEVNPRPSASAELIDDSGTLFRHHYNACLGVLPNNPIASPINNKSLRYLFAKTDYCVPENMAWPAHCHDIPKENTVLKQNDPICSVLLCETEQISTDNNYEIIERRILQQLIKTKSLEK